jgi:hypothetical protein
MTNTKQMLTESVQHIRDQIQHGITLEEAIEDYGFEPECDGHEPDAVWYLSDALDIEYTVTSDKEYLGARVLVTFGGPNIYIDTRKKEVQGYWGMDKVIMDYTDDAFNLDDTLEMLFNC